MSIKIIKGMTLLASFLNVFYFNTSFAQTKNNNSMLPTPAYYAAGQIVIYITHLIRVVNGK